jgi:hypothetical protein
MNILIVHGYGYANHEDAFWWKYFDGIKRIIENHGITHVIWSWGYTSDPAQSEAWSMMEFYKKNYGSPIHHVLEEKSETTLENIMFSKELMETQNFPISTIHTVGSNAHCYKSFYLVLKFIAWLGEENVFELLLDQWWWFDFKNATQNVVFEYEQYFSHGIEVWLSPHQFAHQIAGSMMTMWFERYPKIHTEFKRMRKVEKLEFKCAQWNLHSKSL